MSLHLDCVTLTESLGLGGPDFVRCKIKLSIMRAVRVKRSTYVKPPLHCEVKSQKLGIVIHPLVSHQDVLASAEHIIVS